MKLEDIVFDKEAAKCYKASKKVYNHDKKCMEVVLTNAQFTQICREMFEAGLKFTENKQKLNIV